MVKVAPLLPLLLFLLSASLVLSYNTQLERCESECRHQQPPQQREQCMLRCQEKYGEGKEYLQREQSRNNPFFFDEESFRTALRTQEGNLRFLERFSDRSDLLRGLENFRLVVFEANPNSALIPTHCDTEQILFVVAGSATITLLHKENRESYNLRRGDVLRVHAGTALYIINRDNKEKLFIAKLLETISVPGQVEIFFGIGGRGQESFYMSFGKDILEAAFNTQHEKARRVFGENKHGAFVSVSQEKIRQITQQASSSSEEGHSHYGERWRGPFNLFEQRPTYSNRHGRLYEVDTSDYPALRPTSSNKHVNVSVSFATIRGGSMSAPYYNTKAIKVSLIVDGKGYVEIVSPYLSDRGRQEKEEQEESVSYRRLSAQVSTGQGFIVPAGHPLVVVADPGQDLRILCFEIKVGTVSKNEKYPLAGRDNIFNKMNREDRELFFKEPEGVVEQVFEAQKESGFFDGPQGRRERESEGRSDEIITGEDEGAFL